jgi:osmotically-inducible protein OsmY
MKTDLEIQKSVMDEINWEPFLNAAEIGVAVKDGVATLSGIVDSYPKKYAAEKAAKRVTGVKAVAEDIEVRLPFESKKTDTEIALAAADALKWNTSVKEDQVKLKVENGWVTMEGEVDWEFQKNAARHAVEYLTGVNGVINKIILKPTLTSKDIKKEIASAFHRSATIDSDKVQAEVLGNTVVLTGKVRSWAEKKDAEKAVWNAKGIISVENKLSIDTDVYAY